jgi:hypothetical protein
MVTAMRNFLFRIGQNGMQIGMLTGMIGICIVSPLAFGVGCGLFCIGTYLRLFAEFRSL